MNVLSITVADDHHKAAIMLNNAAVTLLMRGHVRESIETLGDAVKIIRSKIGSIDAPSSDESRTLSGRTVREVLDRSNQKMCRIGALYNTAVTATMPKLQIISSQHNPARVLELLTCHVDCPSAFPVMIDPVDFGNQPSDGEVELEAAIILYNYGIAIHCLAHMGLHPFEGTKESLGLLDKSHQMFRMVVSVLDNVDEENQYSHCTCSDLATNILLLRLVLLHSLMDASIRLDLTDAYDMYCHDIQCVMDAIKVFQALIPVLDHHIAAAA